MLFQTCHFFCRENDVFRQQWDELHPLTELSYNHYKDRLKEPTLDAVHETSKFCGTIKSISPHGAAIFNLHMTGIIGLAGLFLSGKVSRIEQMYCRKFQQGISKFASPPIDFPLSPFEIISRPLMYYILFTLDDSDLWKSSANEMILWANGVGWAIHNQQASIKPR